LILVKRRAFSSIEKKCTCSIEIAMSKQSLPRGVSSDDPSIRVSWSNLLWKRCRTFFSIAGHRSMPVIRPLGARSRIVSQDLPVPQPTSRILKASSA